MKECKFLGTCPFFNDVLESMPSTAEALKDRYCRNDSKKCARYQVRINNHPVPDDLFPHQADKTHDIISDLKR